MMSRVKYFKIDRYEETEYTVYTAVLKDVEIEYADLPGTHDTYQLVYMDMSQSNKQIFSIIYNIVLYIASIELSKDISEVSLDDIEGDYRPIKLDAWIPYDTPCKFVDVNREHIVTEYGTVGSMCYMGGIFLQGSVEELKLGILAVPRSSGKLAVDIFSCMLEGHLDFICRSNYNALDHLMHERFVSTYIN